MNVAPVFNRWICGSGFQPVDVWHRRLAGDLPNREVEMKAVVLAYNQIGCAGLTALLRHGIDVAAVFTHTDDPNETIWFDSVAQLAASKGIPVFAPDDINHPLWVKRIRDLKPDVLFSFYYRRMAAPAIRRINWRPSKSQYIKVCDLSLARPCGRA